MKKKQYIVIKIGSSVITNDENRLDTSLLSELARQIKQLAEKEIGVCLVMSGAAPCGRQFSSNSLSQQALCGIGQAYITQTLSVVFQQHGLLLSQLLLSKHDLENARRKAQIKDILLDTIQHNIIPVLNENDVVSFNSFSGNDFLAAEIAKLIQADSLLLLTDVEGVYDKEMQVMTHLSQNDNQLAILKKQYKKSGFGGIQAKITAARLASKAGITTFISSGREKNVLSEMILKNKHIGTKVL